jgi:acylphosphatase
MVKIRIKVYISGVVQGVFFRVSMRKKGIELGLQGFVQNLDEGCVYAVVEGEETSIRKLVEWCNKGPPGAIVEEVKVKLEEYKGEFQAFKIV